ncbi:DUF6086 family protein [Nonomuraea sp. NPDC000554]|uniref:DUF6086 family protein n=1 Tax=Nonomuraea sp. NPDC000554 TaxID=3154259 RepID=UPI0033245363
MSQYFQVGERVLWNPATGVARVFVSSAEAFADLVALPTGVGSVIADEYEIDLAVFGTLVDTLVHRYANSNHMILRSLMEGFLATALVLVHRGNGLLPALEALKDHPDVRHLTELSKRHAAAMAS